MTHDPRLEGTTRLPEALDAVFALWALFSLKDIKNYILQIFWHKDKSNVIY